MIHETAASLLTQLQDGSATSVDVTQAYLDQIEKHDAQVGAFLAVDKDAAIQQARDIDERRAAGKPVGKLE